MATESMSFPRPVERGGAEFERELQAFRGLLNELSDVPDLLRSERMATAFVVEDFKREASEAWENKVNALREELRTLQGQEGVPGVTWRLAQEVHGRYSAHLARCLEEERDETRRGNLQFLQRRIQGAFETRRAAYEAKQRVPIGSVILEHVPRWFAQA